MKCITCIRQPVRKKWINELLLKTFIFNIFYVYKLRNIEKEIIMGC